MSSNNNDLEALPLIPKDTKAIDNSFSRQDYLNILCLSSATICSCLLSGIVTISLPQMAIDLGFSAGQALWPITVFSMGTACSLLIGGSISDIVGHRCVFLVGNLLQAAACVACGLSNTGWLFICCRIISGLAVSCCQPSAISLVTLHFSAGKARNFAMSCVGGGQPVGFAMGISLGGILTQNWGWRWSFYIMAGLSLVVFCFSYWQLPPDDSSMRWTVIMHNVRNKIDWIGGSMTTVIMAALVYGLSEVTNSVTRARDIDVVCCFVVSLVTSLVFIIHEYRQEKRDAPVMIRLSMWKNRPFATICINIFLVWGGFNTSEQLINFIFQDVQGISPVEAAWRFLPAPIFAVFYNISIGLILHRTTVATVVGWTTPISSISILLMAFCNPDWSYWVLILPALVLSSLASDTLFCVSNTMIEDNFSEDSWALAAGIFNTVSQLGKAANLAMIAMISSNVTEAISDETKLHSIALMRGYQAGFVFLFLSNMISLAITILGLRTYAKSENRSIRHKTSSQSV